MTRTRVLAFCGLLTLGLCLTATLPATAQVHKAPVLSVSPAEGLSSSGNEGGPFTPSSRQYTVSNAGDGTLTWSVTADQPWVTVSAVPAGAGTILAVGSARAASGNVDIPLSLLRGSGTTADTGPSALDFVLTYNPAVLDFQSATGDALLEEWYSKDVAANEVEPGRVNVVVAGFSRFEITTYDNQRDGGTPASRINPFPLGTLRFAVVGATGASTTIGVDDLTMVDGGVPPQYLANVSASVGSFTVGTGAPTYTGSGATNVALNAQAAALQGSAAGTAYNATVTFTSNGGPATRTVTLTVIDTCAAPAAPANVLASDGAYPDRIRVTWSAVAGATQYQVYRSDTDNVNEAQALSTFIAQNSFDDYSAQAGTGGGGCSGGGTPRYYYYFVRAKNDCGNGPLSASDRGHRGTSRKSARTGGVYEPALPAGGANEALLPALPDSKLYLRLRADKAIAQGSLWGEADADRAATQWLPASADGRDGWLVFTPEAAWTPGAVVTVRGGGRTVSGENLGPLTQQFRIEAAGLDAGETPVRQPAYGADFDAIGIDRSAEDNSQASILAVADGAVPPFAEGLGQAFRIGPNGAFETPQRVWLPVPEGAEPGSLVLYYYHSAGADSGWYPADQVEGWLVPSSTLRLDLEGGAYLGFVIRHGAVVQLGKPAAEASAQATMVPAVNGLGDAVVFAVVALALLAVGRRRKMLKHLK